MKKSVYILILTILLFLCGCKHDINLTDCVSEYRNNIYIGTNGKYTVFIACSIREYPYIADGIVSDRSELLEITLTAPDNTKSYSASFTTGEQEYLAEFAFDSVLSVYQWSQTVPLPEENEIIVQIGCTDTEFEPIEIRTESVKNDSALSLNQLLEKVYLQKQTLFDSCIQNNRLNGEIYVRLLNEESYCYYYIEITDQSRKKYSFLADATTGKIIAEKY